MGKQEEWFDPDPPAPSKKDRRCVTCESPLSMYNKSNRCFRHPSVLRESLSRSAGGRLRLSKAAAAMVTPVVAIQPDRIIELVCEVCSISRAQLLRRGRVGSDPDAVKRQVAIYLLRKDARLKGCEIAPLFDGKSSTSLFQATRRIDELISMGAPEICHTINRVRSLYVSASDS